jgi:hypothetical protein
MMWTCTTLYAKAAGLCCTRKKEKDCCFHPVYFTRASQLGGVSTVCVSAGKTKKTRKQKICFSMAFHIYNKM